MRSALSRYETVLAALDAGVVIHGSDSAILEANERAREMLGIRDLDGLLASDPAWTFFDEDMMPLPIDEFPVSRVIKTLEPVRGQLVVLAPPVGPNVFVEANAVPRFDEGGHLLEVAVTFIDVTDRVARRIESELVEKHLREVALTDELTGLGNRRAILGAADHAVATAGNDPLAFLMIDLDHFKSVNDTFGHGRGDEVLQQMGSAIAAGLRQGDLLGRFGGEEFLAVLPGADRDAALAVAERLREVVRDAGEPFGVSASIGVAMRETDEAAASLIRRSDQALYAAKAAGRNTVREHSAI